MNCIIVDDDLFSTKVLSSFIERTPSLLTLRKFDNAIDAMNYINCCEQHIDIIFLDIEMPEMSGIDFIKSINADAQIIINTTQEKYALVSYEYDVCDYLLKPATYARFIKSISKAEKEINKNKQQQANITPNNVAQDNSINFTSDFNLDTPEIVFIRDVSGIAYRISITDILYIEAMENYISVHTTNKKITAHITLKEITEKLTDRHLIRIHKSFSVGISHIKAFSSAEVTLDIDNIKLPIGRAYRDTIKSAVGSRSHYE